MPIDFCSLAATDEPLIGTAKHNHAHFILGMPKKDWGPKLAKMDGPAGDFARLIASLDDKVIFTLKNCPPEETGTIWVMPHKLRFDGLTADDFPELVEQTLNGDIKFPHQPLDVDKLIFVCTHGLRDACCAKHGTEFLARLREEAPEHITVWESSHLGGHRFAAVVVAYPGARWYGRLIPDDAPALINAVQQNTVLLDHYRGNAGLPPALQVAERWGLANLNNGGDLNLLNPFIEGHRAQVEVWIGSQKMALTLEGQPHDFRANCADDNLSERILWQVTHTETIA